MGLYTPDGQTLYGLQIATPYLGVACQGQIAAFAAGEFNYTVPSEAACDYGHSQFLAGGNFLTGGKDWAACLRLADRLDPSYKN